MKTCILLLLASMLGAAAQAPSPAAAPAPGAPPAGKPATNQLGEMRRALRQAMTNAATAAVATNTARPSGATAVAVPVTTATAPATGEGTTAATAAGAAAAAPANPNLRPVPTRSSATATTPPAPGGVTRPAVSTPPVTRPAPAPGGGPAAAAAPAPALPGTAAPAVAAGAAAPTAGPAVPPPAVETTDDGQPDPDQIIPAGTLQVQNMPLDQFFELYSLISGRTVLRPNALAVGQGAAITLKAQTDWTRKEAVFAMDAALALNGVAILPIDEKFVKAVAKQDAPTEGAQLSKVRAGNYSESDEFVTQVVELKVLKPSEVVQLIQSFSKVPNGITPFDNNNTIVIRDHAMNVKRMLEVIEKVDVAKETDYKLEIIPIRYGRVEDFFNTMSSLVSGSGGAGGANLGSPTGAGTTGTSVGMQQQQGRGRGSGRMGRTQGGGYGSGMYGGGMYGGAGGMYGGGMYGGGRYYPQQATVPQQTSVGGAQSSFQQRLQQIVNRAARPGEEEVQVLENAKLVPDPKSNTLLIYAHKKDLEMITNIVAKLDVLQAQVLIEAVIFEVTLGDNLNFGVSMAQSPKRFGQDFAGAGAINNGQGYLAGAMTNFPGALPGGLTYFSKIGGDLDVTLKAIADNSDINVLSRPRIQTSHAIPGAFFVGEQIPYSSGAYDYGFGTTGSGITRSIVAYLDVGFDLSVTPYITPEGYVVMEIYQEFKNRTRDVIIDGNPIPSVNQRSAEASVIVRDGQTIMLGGFIGERKSHSKSGVPFLKDIPGLGFFFRSSNDSSERIELVVLMRAKVLHTPEDAFHVAEQETAELPGVRNAQQEFKKTDEKRRKQIEKRKK